MNLFAVTLTILLLAASSVVSANVLTVTGKVVELDAEAKTVSIESEVDKKRVTYRYIDGLRVESAPQRKNKMEDLRKGEKVVLTLEIAEN